MFSINFKWVAREKYRQLFWGGGQSSNMLFNTFSHQSQFCILVGHLCVQVNNKILHLHPTAVKLLHFNPVKKPGNCVSSIMENLQTWCGNSSVMQIILTQWHHNCQRKKEDVFLKSLIHHIPPVPPQPICTRAPSFKCNTGLFECWRHLR